MQLTQTRKQKLGKYGFFCAKAIQATFSSKNIAGRILHWYTAPRYIGVGIRLRDPNDLGTAIKLANPIGYAAGLGDGSTDAPVVPVILGFYLFYQFQIPPALWQTISINDEVGGAMGVGVGAQARPVIFSFDDAPHSLVAGTTKSGKSTLTRTILFRLMRTHRPDDLGIMVVDPHRDYEMFQNTAHLLAPVVHSQADIHTAIRMFSDETRRRAEENIRDAQRWLLVIDEADKAFIMGNDEMRDHITSIARVGRAFRCHLLVSTHKPDAASIGPVRDELDNRFLGKVTSAQTSGQLGGGLNLHKLTGTGDFVHVVHGRSFRFQVAVVPDSYYDNLPRGHIKPLPTPAESSVAIYQSDPRLRSSRPYIHPDPKSVAYYLYHGSDLVTQAEVETELDLKRTGHERNKAFAQNIENYLTELKAGNGRYT